MSFPLVPGDPVVFVDSDDVSALKAPVGTERAEKGARRARRQRHTDKNVIRSYPCLSIGAAADWTKKHALRLRPERNST